MHSCKSVKINHKTYVSETGEVHKDSADSSTTLEIAVLNSLFVSKQPTYHCICDPFHVTDCCQ